MDSGVANFFLIDQSLKGVGGHHFDYSYQIAKAAMNRHAVADLTHNRSSQSSRVGDTANGRGPSDLKVVIGANRKFSNFDAFPQCEVRSCFRYTTYSPSSNLVGIREMVGRRKEAGWLRSLFGRGDQERSNAADRKKRISTFRNNLQTFFCEELSESDIVFFTTLSDLEAEGLRQFISQRSDAQKANWHLQFHFPIFRGRTSEYAEQCFRLKSIRPVFEKLELLRGGTNIRYYVTSAPLREQYRQLGIDFENLPYPIDPSFREARNDRSFGGEEASADGVFRLTFAGASRKEKGELAICELADELPKDFVQRNNVKIVTQQKKAKFWRRVSGFLSQKPDEPQDSVFEALRFPLSDSQYQNLIKRTHIGLLTTYDSRTYFSRRAGILGEYLAAGIPVVVPAGCWLSQQIEVVQQKYLQRLANNDCISTESKSVSVDGHGLCQINLPVVQRELHSSDPPGLRMMVLRVSVEDTPITDFIEVCRLDEQGKESDSQIAGRPTISGESPVNSTVLNRDRYFAFYIDPAESTASLRIRTAFVDDSKNALGHHECCVASATVTILDSNRPIPRSSVGMVSTTPSQTAQLIQEMVSQYSHYKKTAEENSETWYQNHDPNLTFSTLLNHSNCLLEWLTEDDSEKKTERSAA